jgi:hypothetical protein
MSRLSRSRRSYSRWGGDLDIDNAIRKFGLFHPLTFHLFNTKKSSIMAEPKKQEPIAPQLWGHPEAASNPAVPRQLGQQPQGTPGTAVPRGKYGNKWPQQAAQLHNAMRASAVASMAQLPSYGQANNLPTPAASPLRLPLYQPQPQLGQLHRTIRPKTTTILPQQGQCSPGGYEVSGMRPTMATMMPQQLHASQGFQNKGFHQQNLPVVHANQVLKPNMPPFPARQQQQIKQNQRMMSNMAPPVSQQQHGLIHQNPVAISNTMQQPHAQQWQQHSSFQPNQTVRPNMPPPIPHQHGRSQQHYALPQQQHGLPQQQHSSFQPKQTVRPKMPPPPIPHQQHGRSQQQYGLPELQRGLLQQYGLPQQHSLPQQYGMQSQLNQMLKSNMPPPLVPQPRQGPAPVAQAGPPKNPPNPFDFSFEEMVTYGEFSPPLPTGRLLTRK